MVVIIDCLLSVMIQNMHKQRDDKEATYLRKISLSGMMLPLVGFALRFILEQFR